MKKEVEKMTEKQRHEWNKMCAEYGMKELIISHLFKKPNRKRSKGGENKRISTTSWH